MPTDPNNPPSKADAQTGDTPPPPFATAPPVMGAPSALATSIPPLPPPLPKPNHLRQILALLLSLGLGLFLADGFISLFDDALIVFLNLHLLAAVRGIVFLSTGFVALVIYGLMAFTPMIPKRLFLPVALFNPLAALAVIPFLIYCYDRIQEVALGISVCEVVIGMAILYRVQGGMKLRWPLIGTDQLVGRRFSWVNFLTFFLTNVLVLPPVVVVYFFVCTALAVDHFSEGFVALHPGGLAVQVREYVRNDGKKIRLIPMAHIGDASFYRAVSRSFPTNSTILLEGVTDNQNLLTNKITYKRMANSLGLAEQQREFKPSQGEMVQADVDVEEFNTNTIGLLNLAMLVHRKGLNVETLTMMMQCSPPADVQEQLVDDLLHKRNHHLLEEIETRLPESEHLMVPWGAAHMPEIAREIQKSGFSLGETHEYMVVRFRFASDKGKAAAQSEDRGRPK